MGRKLLYVFLVLLVSTSLLQAQNNPYKIKDGLYVYYQQCAKALKEKRVLLMVDTLFTRSGREGDQKAQCLALNLKCDYYYFQKDFSALKDANERLRKFAIHTPYQQYIFGCWGRLITYYIREKQYDNALEECRAYQQEAIRLNNDYGIATSYRILGNIYYEKLDKFSALEQYRKEEQYYLTRNQSLELGGVYSRLCQCFMQMSMPDSSIYYGNKALQYINRDSEKLSVYLYILMSYNFSEDMGKAKSCLDSIERLRKKAPLSGARYSNYLVSLSNYYKYDKQYDRSLTLLDSVQDTLSRAVGKREVYKSMGDYKNAYDWSEIARKHTMLRQRQENAEIMADYASRFDNERLKSEKNRLSLQYAEMNLRRLENERLLMLTDRERDSLKLTATGLQLQNSKLALTNQRVETERQKERTKASEKQNRQQRIIIGVVSLLFIVSLVFFYLLIRHRRKSYLHLQKEKERAVAARHEAEKSRQEAEKARQEAVNANNLKSLFLQNVSHEIRTPLNAIVGFSDILNSPEDMGFSSEERQEYVNIIRTNTVLLTTLVNDILDLSKLESDTYVLSPCPVTVSELCHNTLESVKGRAAAGVEMRLEEPEYAGDIIFTTDAARLQQILTNFLTNACKYTDKGSITLSYRIITDNGGMEFAVTDTGCGIPSEKAEQVFDRFEKLDSFKQGTGIGLNICRRIADLVGGRVYVDTSYTGGARFVFIHPPLERNENIVEQMELS